MASLGQLIEHRGLPAVLAIVIAIGCILKLIAEGLYNVFKSPLSGIPGPVLAKLSPSYLAPASIRGDRAQVLLGLHKSYGSVVRVGTNEVSLSDPAMYREIYNHTTSTKDESFYSAARFLNHENIFSMRNKAEHSARRKLQRQPYSQRAVLENENLIASTADSLVNRMVGNVRKFGENRNVDVFPLCGLFSLEIICKVGFNKDLREDKDNIALTLLQVMDESAKLLPIDATFPFLKRCNIGQHLPSPVGNIFRSFYKWMDLTKELLKDFRQSHLRDDTSQRFMATPLLMDEDHYLGRRLTEDEAVEEAMGLAFAGSGTTATTLLYILYHMSRPENQHHQEKLRAELLSNGESINELQQLPYLNAVIKEVMRLNPTIISTLPRILDVDLPVGKAGVTLPKGTVVGMQNYVHHRNPAAFPKPESFQPTRWLGDCDMAEKSFTPFSLGPRNCIGQNLARAELYLATSKIFRTLSVSLSPSMQESDMEMEDRFNISPRGRKLLLDIVPIN